MTPGTGYPGTLQLLWGLLTGRRTVEHSGPLLRAFVSLPAPLRDATRWVLRPKRRFLFGRLRALTDDVVCSGPFAGMRLRGHPAAPELLGTYEHELAGVVTTLAASPFRTVINIGARFGYYAVGLARLMPGVRVLAFEGDGEARVTLGETVTANGVSDRVQILGFCGTADLATAVGDGEGVLIVCDIDGGETLLLDPCQVSGLAGATLLVECHGPPDTPTEGVMAMRFLPTHEVQRIDTEARVLAHLPPGAAEPWRSRMPQTLESLLQEHRTPPQSWLLLTPRRP